MNQHRLHRALAPFGLSALEAAALRNDLEAVSAEALRASRFKGEWVSMADDLEEAITLWMKRRIKTERRDRAQRTRSTEVKAAGN